MKQWRGRERRKIEGIMKYEGREGKRRAMKGDGYREERRKGSREIERRFKFE